MSQENYSTKEVSNEKNEKEMLSEDDILKKIEEITQTHIVDDIGTGGFSQVKMAYSIEKQKAFALKIVKLYFFIIFLQNFVLYHQFVKSVQMVLSLQHLNHFPLAL